MAKTLALHSQTQQTLTPFAPKLIVPLCASAAAVVLCSRLHRCHCAHRPRPKLSHQPNTHHRCSSFVSRCRASARVLVIFAIFGVVLLHCSLSFFFNVRCPFSSSSAQPLNWDIQFYDELQNQIGGGKPKMRWYFKEHGWPSSSLFKTPPTNDEDRANLIDTLQDWKKERHKDIIKSGIVKPRPGVLRLMDKARDAGKMLVVCSAATKSSVILCLENLIGIERVQSLDCFLAGDDVKEKKPDPSIYLTASKKLGVKD